MSGVSQIGPWRSSTANCGAWQSGGARLCSQRQRYALARTVTDVTELIRWMTVSP